jgi:hypothetical protein
MYVRMSRISDMFPDKKDVVFAPALPYCFAIFNLWDIIITNGWYGTIHIPTIYNIDWNFVIVGSHAQ